MTNVHPQFYNCIFRITAPVEETEENKLFYTQSGINCFNLFFSELAISIFHMSVFPEIN